ncbi:hypothetical protein KY329_03795 [Candidatus Woesearchaeota archaeon]|nr:hypothetical protein [Candidatus Woesearchaeota archaeon]
MSLALSLAEAAPIYNLGLVVLAAILFIRLFTVKVRNKKVYLTPWKLLFFAMIIFVIEEVLTILRTKDIVNIPIHINGFFELVIIITFIYALLLQKERIAKTRLV